MSDYDTEPSVIHKYLGDRPSPAAPTCGHCRDCRHFAETASVGQTGVCRNRHVPVSYPLPDFGCVLFDPKPQPVRRITAVWPIPGFSDDETDPGRLQQELDRGNVRLTPVRDFTHVASNDICAWLVRIEE